MAGRSTFLDGGFRTCVLDAVSGEVLTEARLDDSACDFLNLKLSNRTPVPGGGSDILVGDGAALYMRKEKVFSGLGGQGGNRTRQDEGGVPGWHVVQPHEHVVLGEQRAWGLCGGE